MNQRERAIFLRGVAMGMKASEEFDAILPQSDEKKVKEVKKVIKSSKKKQTKIRYTEKEIELLKDSSLRNKDVAKLTGRTYGSISMKRTAMGVKFVPNKEEDVSNIAKLNQD